MISTNYLLFLRIKQLMRSSGRGQGWRCSIDLPPHFFFSASKRRLGSPEKKAPLVRSNFAHLFLPATDNPRHAEFSTTHALHLSKYPNTFLPGEYVHFEPIARFPAQQIRHLCSSRISLPFTQAARISLSSAFTSQLFLNETFASLP